MKGRVLLGLLLLAAGWCGRLQAQTNIAPRADAVLRNACQYLAEAPFFGLSAEIWREHVVESGQRIEFSRTIQLEVKRPNRFHVEIDAPRSQRGFWYDGKDLTILDRRRNLFSTTGMPDTIDATVDASQDQFGIDLPLIDLALSDPYHNAMAQVQGATYYGPAPVMGYSCHHLAFTQDNIDWQVWIQDGPQPFIRKFVITHKNEPGMPQFGALITQWNMTDRIAESDFVFAPPTGALKIPMRKDAPIAAHGNGGVVPPMPTGRTNESK